MQHRPVTSNVIESLAYDEAAQRCEVRLKGGRLYQATGFSPMQYAEWEAAPSKGRHFNAIKQAGVVFTRVEEPAA